MLGFINENESKMPAEKHGQIAPATSESDYLEAGSQTSVTTLTKRILRLATFQRAHTYNQVVKERSSWKDTDKDVVVHKTHVSGCIKYSYGAPQFAILALYMLLAVHATLLYEYLGAPLAYLAFFTAFARSLDVFTDPVMSWITDSTRTKYGRRIPYMVGGCGLYGAAVILLLGVGVINPQESNNSCIINSTSTSNVTTYVLDGTGSTTNVSMSYWYGAFFVLFYIADTICNVPYNALAPELSDDSQERENVYFTQNVLGMLGTMLGATIPPILEEVGLSKEWAFMATGIFFAVYYISTTANLAANVGERSSGFEDQQTVALVPSTIRSFSNPAFRILLISWFIDAVGWFSLAATLPFYVKYVLQPGKAGVEWMSDEIFLGVALTTLFLSAIIGMPFWKLCARYFGRYKAWLAYNLWNGMSNAAYLAVGPQQWQLAIIVTVLNGIPFGGKFLSDATLADSIDYDEFKSGERREAQYTVFASFIPKIVSIPSQALPLAIIGALGFLPSTVVCDEDGITTTEVSEQTDAVKFAIHMIFGLLPVVSNLISFAVKTKYPFTSKHQIDMVSAGIALHAVGLPAEDPITGELVNSPSDFTAEELKLGIDFDYFFSGEKRKILLNNGKMGPVIISLVTSIVSVGTITATSLYGVIVTFYLLEDTALSWVPSFLQISVGLSLMHVMFNILRLRHALRFRNKPFPKGFMKKWIQKSEGGVMFDESMNPLLAHPEMVLAKLKDEDYEDDVEEDDSVTDRRRKFGAKPGDDSGVGVSFGRSFVQPSKATYAGSTRNLVTNDDEERKRILQNIVSGRNLI